MFSTASDERRRSREVAFRSGCWNSHPWRGVRTAAYKPPHPLTALGRARALGRIDVRCPRTNEVIRKFNDFIQLDENRREEKQAFDS
jgi:hypothetical protein